MSTIKVPNGGELLFLDGAISSITPTYHLYRNDVTPGNTTVLGDFTEANYNGYVSQSPVSWNTATTNGSGEAEKTAETLEFQCDSDGGSSNTIYGYYVTNGASGLLWAERFDTSQTIANMGDSVNIPVRIQLRSIY